MKDDTVYLRHMLDAINWIESYASGSSDDQFRQDHLVQDGVIRQISVLGEAARQTSNDFQASHTNVEWSKIIGMRNVLIHDYLGVDVDEVWRTVQHDLPMLKEQLALLLQT